MTAGTPPHDPDAPRPRPEPPAFRRFRDIEDAEAAAEAAEAGADPEHSSRKPTLEQRRPVDLYHHDRHLREELHAPDDNDPWFRTPTPAPGVPPLVPGRTARDEDWYGDGETAAGSGADGGEPLPSPYFNAPASAPRRETGRDAEPGGRSFSDGESGPAGANPPGTDERGGTRSGAASGGPGGDERASGAAEGGPDGAAASAGAAREDMPSPYFNVPGPRDRAGQPTTGPDEASGGSAGGRQPGRIVRTPGDPSGRPGAGAGELPGPRARDEAALTSGAPDDTDVAEGPGGPRTAGGDAGRRGAPPHRAAPEDRQGDAGTRGEPTGRREAASPQKAPDERASQRSTRGDGPAHAAAPRGRRGELPTSRRTPPGDGGPVAGGPGAGRAGGPGAGRGADPSARGTGVPPAREENSGDKTARLRRGGSRPQADAEPSGDRTAQLRVDGGSGRDTPGNRDGESGRPSGRRAPGQHARSSSSGSGRSLFKWRRTDDTPEAESTGDEAASRGGGPAASGAADAPGRSRTTGTSPTSGAAADTSGRSDTSRPTDASRTAPNRGGADTPTEAEGARGGRRDRGTDPGAGPARRGGVASGPASHGKPAGGRPGAGRTGGGDAGDGPSRHADAGYGSARRADSGQRPSRHADTGNDPSRHADTGHGPSRRVGVGDGPAGHADTRNGPVGRGGNGAEGGPGDAQGGGWGGGGADNRPARHGDPGEGTRAGGEGSRGAGPGSGRSGGGPGGDGPDTPGPLGEFDGDDLPEDPNVAAPSGRRRLVEALWPPRVSRAQLVVGVLLFALGAGLAIQVRSNTESDPLRGARQSDLVRVLDELEQRTERLDTEKNRLEANRDQLESSNNAAEAARAQTDQRAQVLGILAGTVKAVGPGITLTINDPNGVVRPDMLLDTLQELRAAGAEAIQINQVRVVAETYFNEPTQGQMEIDGQRVQQPYVFKVIGNPQDLQPALNIPGGVIRTLEKKQAQAVVVPSQQVVVDALRVPTAPDYARSAPDAGNGG